MSDAGEIIGRLKLDASQWDAEIDRAGTKALELSHVDPTVRIKTDGAAKATAELEGVKVASDEVNRSVSEQGKAGQQGAAGMGLLFASLYDVILAAPPVAAAAVGIGGAFVGAGVTAVLAVKGIANEMAAGTSEGRAYSAVVDGLKGDLNSLSAVAAHGVLSGVQQGVTVLNSQMPALNGYTALYAQSLGRIIPTGLEAVFNVVRVGAPLFLDAEAYLERFVHGIAGFTAGAGFEQFIAYAVANLPNVEALISTLLHTVGQILAAWGPIGAAALPVLTGLVGLIGDLPIPVLQALLVTVGLVWTAFQAWQVIPGIVTAVGAAIDFMTGPVGLALAGLGALAAVVGLTAANMDTGTTSVADFSAALQQSNGIVDESVRHQVALSLAQAGVYSAAAKAGISISTVTSAALGNKAAIAQVNTAYAANQKVLATGTAATHGKYQADVAAAKAAGQVRDAVNGTNSKLSEQVRQARQVATATGSMSGTVNTASAAYRTLAGAIDLATTAEYKNEMTSDEAVIAIGGMKSALEASAKAAKDHKVSLDASTVAGAQNREEITRSMEPISKHAQQMLADGKSAAEAKAYTDKMTASLIDNAVKAGANREAVAGLIAKILGIPKSAAVRITADTAAAESKLLSIQSHMNNLNGTAATVYVNAVANGVSTGRAAQVAKNAYGAHGGTAGSSSFGAIPHLAAGGTISGAGNAASDTAGQYVLANGEEVVSDLFGGASTFRPLLKAVSAGQVKTKQDAAQALGLAQSQQPVTVIVHARDGAPDFTDYIDVRVLQGITGQQAANARTVRMGALNRGALAGA